MGIYIGYELFGLFFLCNYRMDDVDSILGEINCGVGGVWLFVSERVREEKVSSWKICQQYIFRRG